MKPSETVDLHIKFLWHSIANLYNQLAFEHDLTQATGCVLLNIDEEMGTPATKIAPLMRMEATSLSRVILKMEDESLLYREKGKDDGRLVRIHLTETGLKKKKIAKKVVKEFNQYVIDRMDKKELACYFDSMRSINRIVEEYKIEKFGGNE